MKATDLTTTLGGFLNAVGLIGIGMQSSIPQEFRWIPIACAGAGAMLLGWAAKGKDVHSTLEEVDTATKEKEVAQKAQQKK